MIARRTRVAHGWLPALFAAALLAAGCGVGGDKPASVSGHVVFNGKPVTSGVVVLIGANGKASEPGSVQSDGAFSIAKSPAGKVKVSFDNPPPPPVTNQPGAANPEAKEQAETAAHYTPTPLAYKDPDQSGVTLDLKAGKNENIEIKLPPGALPRPGSSAPD
jgi:hypothetical protein